MGQQKVTIECPDCKVNEYIDTEKCILILWKKDQAGVLAHSVGPEDILYAMRRLMEEYAKQKSNQEHRN